MNGGKRKEGGGKKQKNLQPYYKNSHKNSKSFSLSLSFFPLSTPTIVEIFSHVKLSENKIKNTQRNYIGCRVEFVGSFARSFVRWREENGVKFEGNRREAVDNGRS